MKLYISLLLCLLIFSGNANTQWYAGEGNNRTPAPDTAHQASSGDFGAMLLITNKPDDFFEQWNQHASPTYKPNISTTNEAKRGDVVMAVILFSGCSANNNGNCVSTVTYKVYKPDGSLYTEPQKGELWSNKPAIPKGSMQLSVGNLGFKVEVDDQVGVYRIEAVVQDIISNKQVKLIQTITVTEAS